MKVRMIRSLSVLMVVGVLAGGCATAQPASNDSAARIEAAIQKIEAAADRAEAAATKAEAATARAQGM
jgi:hypothetical protein